MRKCEYNPDNCGFLDRSIIIPKCKMKPSHFLKFWAWDVVMDGSLNRFTNPGEETIIKRCKTTTKRHKITTKIYETTTEGHKTATNRCKTNDWRLKGWKNDHKEMWNKHRDMKWPQSDTKQLQTDEEIYSGAHCIIISQWMWCHRQFTVQLYC